jgi:CheY-like chemotaxis protein
MKLQSEHSLKCQTILLAEDNDDIRQTLAEVLEFEGYAVKTVSNGKEALEALNENRSPMLVLLDLMMPVMSGWEFLDAQKKSEEFHHHPVVVLSAVPATQSLQDSSTLETAGALRKPIDLNRLLETVGRFCDRRTEVQSA